MRDFIIPVIFSCLTLLGASGCGSDTNGTGGAEGGAGGGGGGGGAGGAGGGSADPCEGRACGEACSTCPEGAPCMPQACNSEGICVEEALAVCSACPTTPPPDGEACSPVGLVCEMEAGVVLACRTRTNCMDTGWKTFPPGCLSDPPTDPACPASEPSGDCDVMADPSLCVLAENTLVGCSNCLGGPCGGPAEWVIAAPPVSPCPALAPKLGAGCADEGLSCVYGSCALGGTSGGRTCLGAIWTEDIIPCPL
ncbi:MAG TPA: hypothetical protein VE093_37490 [Polyangiaceae bacterium]|nr:hypothetical protein [Polyangiaceae bacterium]